jgi:hypothetical protein
MFLRICTLVVAVGLGSCAGTATVVNYMVEHYNPVILSHVKRPDDTYRVLEHSRLNRIMVTTSIGAAAGAGVSRGLTFGAVSGVPAKPMFEAAARDYLDRTTRRHCEITDGYVLVDPQWEFKFACKGSKLEKEPFIPFVAPPEEPYRPPS